MKIKQGSEVTFSYRLFSGNELIDETLPGQHMMYTHGEGALIPGLEKALNGLSEGDKKDIIVEPEDGYGVRSEENIISVPRDSIPKEADLREGQRVPGTSPEGEMQVGFIIKVDDKEVVIDFNHELAGQTLRFEVEIIKVINE